VVENIDAQDEIPEKKKTALHYAVERGHIDCARQLLFAKAQIAIPDAKNETAISIAAKKSDKTFYDLLIAFSKEPRRALK
jgi:ankyrin repeat protein